LLKVLATEIIAAMCYYNGIKVSRGEFLRLKEIEKELNLSKLMRPMQSGFEYKEWPIIKPNEDYCDWEQVEMEWGFIPHYLQNREAVKRFREGYKDDKGKFHPPVTTLNAIGEELLQPGKMYRDAALKRRCLFFSSGFYEWRHVFPMGKKGKPLKTSVKYPYHITLPGKQFFFMAGVWQSWTDKHTGETVDTCALVTTTANKVMEQVHNSKKRMPVILTDELAGEWISDGLTEERITEIATFQIPEEQMEVWTLHKDFRTAEEPTEKFHYEDLPQLVL
jgi:putative SOS response-associated peptidase YedK